MVMNKASHRWWSALAFTRFHCILRRIWLLGVVLVALLGPAASGKRTGSAPQITSASNTVFTVGSTGSFTVTSTGVPSPALTATGTLPNGVTFVDNHNGTATLAGTPAAGIAGSYPIRIRASNSIRPDATQDFTLTVEPAPTPTPTPNPTPTPTPTPTTTAPIIINCGGPTYLDSAGQLWSADMDFVGGSTFS